MYRIACVLNYLFSEDSTVKYFASCASIYSPNSFIKCPQFENTNPTIQIVTDTPNAASVAKNKADIKIQVPKASNVPSTSRKVMNRKRNELRAKPINTRKGSAEINVKISVKMVNGG